MKKFTNKLTNAIEPATTTSKSWGFTPVPYKGGKTKNAVITANLNKKETE